MITIIIVIIITTTSLAPDQTLTRPRTTFLPTAKLSPAPPTHLLLLLLHLLLLHLQPPKNNSTCSFSHTCICSAESDSAQLSLSTFWIQCFFQKTSPAPTPQLLLLLQLAKPNQEFVRFHRFVQLYRGLVQTACLTLK